MAFKGKERKEINLIQSHEICVLKKKSLIHKLRLRYVFWSVKIWSVKTEICFKNVATLLILLQSDGGAEFHRGLAENNYWLQKPATICVPLHDRSIHVLVCDNHAWWRGWKPILSSWHLSQTPAGVRVFGSGLRCLLSQLPGSLLLNSGPRIQPSLALSLAGGAVMANEAEQIFLSTC